MCRCDSYCIGISIVRMCLYVGGGGGYREWFPQSCMHTFRSVATSAQGPLGGDCGRARTHGERRHRKRRTPQLRSLGFARRCPAMRGAEPPRSGAWAPTAPGRPAATRAMAPPAGGGQLSGAAATAPLGFVRVVGFKGPLCMWMVEGLSLAHSGDQLRCRTTDLGIYWACSG